MDFAFAGYHMAVLCTLIRLPWLPVVFVILVVSSVGWRWLHARYGGMAIPVITHATADCSVVLAAHWLLR